MCEACGPITEPTAEERRVTRQLIAQQEENNKRRKVNLDAIVDPDCYGSPLKRFSLWLSDTLYNLKLIIGVGV